MIAGLNLIYIRKKPKKAFNRILSHLFFEGRQPTMRWLWLNRLVSMELELLKKFSIEESKLCKVTKPIFIVGIGRSGTTILGNILSFHREVGLLNEAKALWHAAYPFEDVLGTYGTEAYYRLYESDATSEVKNNVRKLHFLFLWFTKSQRLVDKYPEMIFRIRFLRAIYPDLKIILLMRNGWDTIYSIAHYARRYTFPHAKGYVDWWGVNGRKWHLLVTQVLSAERDLSAIRAVADALERHEDRAAVEWILTMREGLRLAESLPDQMCTIRYEDLVTYPECTLRTLLEFCELSQDDSTIAYATQVLKPMSPRKPQDLHANVKDIFIETMNKVGYTL